MLRARQYGINMWVIGKYIGKHTHNMYTFNKNYFNLDTDVIASVFVSQFEVSIRYKVKQRMTSDEHIYHYQKRYFSCVNARSR